MLFRNYSAVLERMRRKGLEVRRITSDSPTKIVGQAKLILAEQTRGYPWEYGNRAQEEAEKAIEGWLRSATHEVYGLFKSKELLGVCALSNLENALDAHPKSFELNYQTKLVTERGIHPRRAAYYDGFAVKQKSVLLGGYFLAWAVKNAQEKGFTHLAPTTNTESEMFKILRPEAELLDCTTPRNQNETGEIAFFLLSLVKPSSKTRG